MAPAANAKYAVRYTGGRTPAEHIASIGAEPTGPMVVATEHWVATAVPTAGTVNGADFDTSMHVLEFLLFQCFSPTDALLRKSLQWHPTPARWAALLTALDSVGLKWEPFPTLELARAHVDTLVPSLSAAQRSLGIQEQLLLT